jgi:putative protease
MAKNYVPELLAPAGSIDALKAAVNAGADAVYISGKRFGARKFATNFSESEIEEGLEYAKLRGVKVYVTVNTLINDSQILSVAEYLIWLYKTGVDAVIIQDLGIASLSKAIVPDLDMHASTQMTIHNIPGVKWASKFGFKRVSLARELGISEVEEIRRENEKIEIEVFGHGALCYSYSGQCLLSSFIGGRSGNKGMCAQPCRKEYTLLSGKVDKFGKPSEYHSIDIRDKYLLSTKDLAVYENLENIAHSKVNSLKIEGRMRSTDYVGIVIKIYRKALDNLSEGNWKPNFEDINKLKLAFNRGFTGGYLTEGYLTEAQNRSVMSREAPGNRGLYIGRVQHFNEKTNIISVKLENNFKMDKGDGIAFLDPQKPNKSEEFKKDSKKLSESYGMALENTPKYKGDKLLLNVGQRVKIGSKLYLTRSISLNHEARAITKNTIQPMIPIDIVMSWDHDLKANLSGKFIGFDGVEHDILLKSDFKMEKAIKKPLTIKQIEDQLQKTGKTPFMLGKVSIKYPGDLFSPISKLNQFRRIFLEKASTKLLETFKPRASKVQEAMSRFEKIKKYSIEIEQKKKTFPPHRITLAVYADSLDTVKGSLDGGAKRVYYEPNPIKNCKDNCNPCYQNNTDSIKTITNPNQINRIPPLLTSAENLCKEYNAEFIWKWPQITHQHQLNNYYKILESQLEDIPEIMVDGLGAAIGIKEFNPHIVLSGSAGLNIWNGNSVLSLTKIFNTLTPSAELTKEELRSIITNSRIQDVNNNFELVVQGNVDTIISKDCLLSDVPESNHENIPVQFWGIQDGKKQIFPIKIDSEGNTHILNSVELCLIDYLPTVSQMGIHNIVLDLRNKTYDYAKEMTSIYNKGLEYTENEINTTKNMNQLKSKIKIISAGGITTGNFLKGVKEK